MGLGSKNKAIFSSLAPLWGGDFLKKDFFDSFNGLR
jgi:hypothetical protein